MKVLKSQASHFCF